MPGGMIETAVEIALDVAEAVITDKVEKKASQRRSEKTELEVRDKRGEEYGNQEFNH